MKKNIITTALLLITTILSAQTTSPTPVLIQVENIYGNPYNGPYTIQPAANLNPQSPDGYNLAGGYGMPGTCIDGTNIVYLVPGGYTLFIPGWNKPKNFTVPIATNVMNILWISNNVPSVYPITISFTCTATNFANGASNYQGQVTFTNPANLFSGTFTGDGSKLTGISVSGGILNLEPTNSISVSVIGTLGYIPIGWDVAGAAATALTTANANIISATNVQQGYDNATFQPIGSYQPLSANLIQWAGVGTNAWWIAMETWVNAQSFLTGNQTITLSGDVTGSGTMGITTILKNTGTAGTYTKTTFDGQGRETSGTVLALVDLPVGYNNTAGLATNVVVGINITNAYLTNAIISGSSLTNAWITNSTFSGNGTGLTSLTPGNLTANGTFPAENSSALTALNASQLSTGTVPIARLPVMTASANGIGSPDNNTLQVSGGILSILNVPLADIAQGGATSSQVLTWSGSAWAPATASSGGGNVNSNTSPTFVNVVATNMSVVNGGTFSGNGNGITNLNLGGTNIDFGNGFMDEEIIVNQNSISVLGGETASGTSLQIAASATALPCLRENPIGANTYSYVAASSAIMVQTHNAILKFIIDFTNIPTISTPSRVYIGALGPQSWLNLLTVSGQSIPSYGFCGFRASTNAGGDYFFESANGTSQEEHDTGVTMTTNVTSFIVTFTSNGATWTSISGWINGVLVTTDTTDIPTGPLTFGVGIADLQSSGTLFTNGLDFIELTAQDR